MEENIVVSISCITYNHVNYIRDALEGFLMQKTNFRYELLIHDDASTDGTKEIIEEYQRQYSELIKPLYEEENQWVKGKRGSAVFNFPRAKGKYIALCEGDDYWKDPYKLQKQVDFLDSNDHYSACAHDVDIEYVDQFERPILFYKSDMKNIDETLHYFFPTCSFLFKTSVLNKQVLNTLLDPHIQGADKIITLASFYYGPIKYFDQKMAVYRKHSGGISFSERSPEHFKESIRLYSWAKKLFKEQHKATFNKKLLINYGEHSVLEWKQKRYLNAVYYLFRSITYIRHFNQMKLIFNDFILQRNKK